MCPLCGSREETLDHITLQCPYVTTVWTGAATRLGLPNIVPSAQAEIGEWWPKATVRFAPSDRKTANSFIMHACHEVAMAREECAGVQWQGHPDANDATLAPR
jgi:hypothetical protein